MLRNKNNQFHYCFFLRWKCLYFYWFIIRYLGALVLTEGESQKIKKKIRKFEYSLFGCIIRVLCDQWFTSAILKEKKMLKLLSKRHLSRNAYDYIVGEYGSYHIIHMVKLCYFHKNKNVCLCRREEIAYGNCQFTLITI